MTDFSPPRGPGAAPDWLAGGGEMGKLIGAMDWSRTPLGPIESWPQSLRTTVSLCLASNFPISIAWGPQRVQIYNDGYWPICGAKHPHSMGQDFKECWFSAWPAIGEAFERASAGETAFLVNQRMFLDRYGTLEETFFTFSFSPIRDESGGVGGLFHPVTEMTQQTLAERRLKALRDLAERATEAKTVAAACQVVAQTLGAHSLDLPFMLLYLLDAGGGRATLAGSAGLPAGTPASPETVDLASPPHPGWPLAEAARERQAVLVEDVEERFGPLGCGPYPESPQAAYVLPILISGTPHPFGLLVAGVSARRVLDEPYQTFYVMLREAVTNALASARAYEEERRRAEALAELDRAKTVFFSNVSHEFRTPLTLILAPLEDTLARSPAAEDRERLEVAHRNCLRLLKLVNSLLDFSRIEAGRIEAAYEPTDLAALTAELASVFRSAVERAGLRLVVRCPPLAEPVHVDREMWEKIVLNLLSNAFKFTFDGEIEVSLRQAGERVELAVRDTGTGIPAAEIPRVFERFHRVKDARGRTFEGSGIGLALVQELVKLHGGTVRVDSEVDRGTTFTVSLPTGTAHLPADRIGAARSLASTGVRSEAYVAEALRWLPEDGSGLRNPGGELEIGTAGESRGSKRGTRNKPTARVLLADDNADMREYVERLLVRSYEVVAVPDGEAALRAAREQSFDLVLSDVMMPRLDGFGLLAGLRADERTRTLPVILLSARAGEESRVEGLEAGADDYVVKPFSARELLARVEAHLRLQRVRREAQAALRASDMKFATAFDRSPLALTITSMEDGRLVEVNDGFVQLSGYTRDEALGRTPEELGLWVDPTMRAERFARLQTGERVPNVEARFRVKGGGELIGVIGSAIVEIDGRACVLSSVIDITDRKRMEEALREADRRKDEFLAMLAHELRNPLAPIRNAAQVLKLLGPADAHQQWAREVIERQTQHLTRLVDDLLDVSRITRGMVALARETLELSAVVHRAVEASRPLLDARRHRLTVSLPPEPVRLEGDLTRLVQVLGNLLNNAAKYTDEGGHVRIEASLEDGEVVLRVCDDGMGMPADLVPNVFDLFIQADRSLDRSQGGLGIGLTLVRHLVELHGGQVEARSDGPGRGSEFVVRLPAAAAGDTAGEGAAAGEDALPASRALKVLVVEDNVDSAEMMAFFLRLRGHEVRTAHDGPAALEATLTFEPQAVLCDIGLPGMNGYEVAARLREQPAFQRTPLIALTGYGQEEARHRSQAAGFDYHLVKPVEPDALAALLDSLRSAERSAAWRRDTAQNRGTQE